MEHEASVAGARLGRPGAGGVLQVGRHATPDLDPLLRAALNAAPSGLIVLDNDRAVRYMTRAAADLLGTGLAPREAPVPIMRLLAQSHWLDEPALRTLAAAFNAPETQDPREVLLSVPGAGATRVMRMELRRAGHEGWVASLSDVSRAHETQDWLLEHAATDPITGIWNRQHFMLMLHERLDGPSAAGTVLLKIDLKRFKQVNDTLGSAVGDALLRLVAARLSGYLRTGDLLARFASDKFAIMLGEPAERSAIVTLGERLCETIARPFLMEGQTITIGAYLGAAVAPADGDTAEVLVANAGLALAAARADALGQPRFFEPRLDEEARHRRSLETDLRHALGRNEFELHYQPQVNMRTHRVSGFEALLRWRNPERGLVPPNDFIPLSEELDLINDIGVWVLHEACREALNWPDNLTVAVNASPLQVEAGNFAAIVARALRDTGFPARRLEIEITENLLLRDNGTVTTTFKALRDQGVGLVLDDFGTGYASLSQLARFHFDKIKIDRSFISSPNAADENAAIVRAIAALGISLSVPTIAEGVETAQQLERVRANGCTEVQGYYYSKPVPPAQIEALLKRLQGEAAVAA
jgi:diguanylate cyclase (GGDEF)-like protein